MMKSACVFGKSAPNQAHVNIEEGMRDASSKIAVQFDNEYVTRDKLMKYFGRTGNGGGDIKSVIYPYEYKGRKVAVIEFEDIKCEYGASRACKCLLCVFMSQVEIAPCTPCMRDAYHSKVLGLVPALLVVQFPFLFAGAESLNKKRQAFIAVRGNETVTLHIEKFEEVGLLVCLQYDRMPLSHFIYFSYCLKLTADA